MKKRNSKQAKFALRRLSESEEQKLTPSFALPEQADNSVELALVSKLGVSKPKLSSLVQNIIAQNNEKAASTEKIVHPQLAAHAPIESSQIAFSEKLSNLQTAELKSVAVEPNKENELAKQAATSVNASNNNSNLELDHKEVEISAESVNTDVEQTTTLSADSTQKEVPTVKHIEAPSYSVRIANLRQALQGKANRKDEKIAAKQAELRKVILAELNKPSTNTNNLENTNSLLSALKEPVNNKTEQVLNAFEIPETASERYILVRKLHLLENTYPIKRFKRKKQADSSTIESVLGESQVVEKKLTAMEAIERLKISRQLLAKTSQHRKLLINRAYRQISDDMIYEAYTTSLKNGAFLKNEASDSSQNSKLSASKRRQARLKLLNQRRMQQVNLLFKRQFTFKQKSQKQAGLRQTWQKLGKILRHIRISAAVITLIVGIGLSLVALLPPFYLENIRVVGNEHLSESELTDFLKIKKGQHLITLLKGNLWQLFQGRNVEIERQLCENYPIIAQARCTVKLPGTLELKVKESTAIAYLKVQGGYANIDANGRILAINMGEANNNVPLIKGLDTSYVQVNQLFAQIKERRFTNAIVFMDNLMRSDADSADHLKLIAALKTIHLMPDASLWLEFDFARANSRTSVATLAKDKQSAKGHVQAEEAEVKPTEQTLPMSTTVNNINENVPTEVKPTKEQQNNANNANDRLLVHVSADIADYANLIYWLRNTKQVGALDNLGSGYLDLTHAQKVFVKSADNTESQVGQKGKLKAEPWDNNAWTWKDIVVKSFKKKVGD